MAEPSFFILITVGAYYTTFPKVRILGGVAGALLAIDLFKQLRLTTGLTPHLPRLSRALPTSLRRKMEKPTHVKSSHTKTPNHALQRTGAAVTLAANSGSNPSRPSVPLSYARSLSPRSTSQPSRQPRPSLSLGSLGVATRYG